MSADVYSNRPNIVQGGRASRWGLRGFALFYLGALLMVPVIMIFYKAFGDGIAHAWESVTTPEAQHAFYLTVIMVLVAVPINTVFGIAGALVIVRQNFRGKGILNTIIDMPFAISPVVIGLSLIFVYGSVDGWFGPWLAEQGIQVIFNPVGMAIATMFVSLPFVVREVIPVLRGDRRRPGAGRLDPRREGLADVLADHPAVDPLGRDLWRDPRNGARARRVRRGRRRFRADLGHHRDPAAPCPQPL